MIINNYLFSQKRVSNYLLSLFLFPHIIIANSLLKLNREETADMGLAKLNKADECASHYVPKFESPTSRSLDLI